MPGKVIFQKTVISLAPSIRAASLSELSTFASADCISTILVPPIHRLRNNTEGINHSLEVIKPTLGSPIPLKNVFITP